MSSKKRIAILGGGITGLTLAHYLSRHSHCEVTLFEKEKRLGGWMQTLREKGFQFETGPRTFKRSRSHALLELVQELGLSPIFSSPEAEVRYLWSGGKLHKVPSFWLLCQILWPLLKEWRIPPGTKEETIWEFALRRFNQRVAELVFDPLVLGIYTGDLRRLSLQASFPFLHHWEQKYGSLTKALWIQRKQKGEGGLFSFAGGVSELVSALVEQSRVHFVLKTEVKQLPEADHIFCTLPPAAAGALFGLPEFSQFPMLPIQVVNVGFSRSVLPKRGFGYLVPTCAGEHVLGVLFDSDIFPQHNRHQQETRFTIMVRSGPDPVSSALDVIQRHLGITAIPEALHVSQASIPQYELGHQQKVDRLEKKLAVEFPHCTLVGNYLRGASVNECVMSAKKAAEHWLKSSGV